MNHIISTYLTIQIIKQMEYTCIYKKSIKLNCFNVILYKPYKLHKNGIMLLTVIIVNSFEKILS